MRLLVTGGAGCLGSNLIEHYYNLGNEICVIDNFSTGKIENLLEYSRLKLVEGSIVDSDLVSNLFADFRPTQVIHCAASYKDPFDWVEDVGTNINGMINLIVNSEKHKVKKFINFQTSLCYGTPYKSPIPINHYLKPKSSYAITKTSGELYLSHSELDYISFRLATVLAPRCVVGAVPTFYKRLLEGKDCFCSDTVRDFMGLNDFLRLIDISLQDSSPKGIFNASTGLGVSMKFIHNTIAEILGIKEFNEPPIVEAGKDDIHELVLDPSETNAAFAWQTTTSLKEDLEKLIGWYQTNGLKTIYSHVLKPDLEKN